MARWIGQARDTVGQEQGFENSTLFVAYLHIYCYVLPLGQAKSKITRTFERVVASIEMSVVG